MCYDDWTFSLFFPFTQRGILTAQTQGRLSQLKSQACYLVPVAFGYVTWAPCVCFLIGQGEIIKGVENPVFSKSIIIVSLSTEGWKDLTWMLREASSGMAVWLGKAHVLTGLSGKIVCVRWPTIFWPLYLCPIEVGLSPKLIQLDSLS